MAGDAYNKAFFTNTDTSEVFYVQFNPKEFKLDEKANWKASDERQEHAPLTLPGTLSTAGHRDQSSVGMFLPFVGADRTPGSAFAQSTFAAAPLRWTNLLVARQP